MEVNLPVSSRGSTILGLTSRERAEALLKKQRNFDVTSELAPHIHPKGAMGVPLRDARLAVEEIEKTREKRGCRWKLMLDSREVPFGNQFASLEEKAESFCAFDGAERFFSSPEQEPARAELACGHARLEASQARCLSFDLFEVGERFELFPQSEGFKRSRARADRPFFEHERKIAGFEFGDPTEESGLD
jgi:hypothetical protein